MFDEYESLIESLEDDATAGLDYETGAEFTRETVSLAMAGIVIESEAY